jgi:hypothetical protein
MGSISEAVGGREGVYVVEVLSVTEAPAINDLKGARQKTSGRIARVVSSGVYQNMKDNADIVDDRQLY